MMKKSPRLQALYNRFAASTRGVAAIEFAMILPVLATLFLATFDGGRALAVYMKVRAATYSLDAITNQYQTIASADMTTIVGATSTVLAPYPGAPAVVTISQIAVNSASNATVAWSYSLNGTALTPGNAIPFTLPTNLSTCGTYPCYLILGQVSYAYTPLFGFFTSGSINLTDALFTTPRSSTCIIYTPQTGTACAVASSGSGSGSVALAPALVPARARVQVQGLALARARARVQGLALAQAVQAGADGAVGAAGGKGNAAASETCRAAITADLDETKVRAQLNGHRSRASAGAIIFASWGSRSEGFERPRICKTV